MSKKSLTGRYSQWISETDEHSGRRIDLLREVDEALENKATMTEEISLRLSDSLERWRYQLLKHADQKNSSRKMEFLETLDLTAHRIAGRGDREPRKTREVVSSGQLKTGIDFNESTIRDFLSDKTELKVLIDKATLLTSNHFSIQRDAGSSGQSPDDKESTSGMMTQRSMVLYAPLYLSNHCLNYCLYCGFRYPNQLERIHLELPEILQQAELLREKGFRNVLLVAGDFPKLTSTQYYVEILKQLNKMDLVTSIEIAPLSTKDYAELANEGACGISLYHETYHEERYQTYHPKGTKALYDWRLEGLERAAEAGIRTLGLGILLGLSEPVDELIALIRHGIYLQSRYPNHPLAFSLPRIHEAPDSFVSDYQVNDELFIRMYSVLRIIFPKAHLLLSTRESVLLRNQLSQICITKMSAGSSTAPGGYQNEADDQSDRQQFPISDHRSSNEVAEWLISNGFHVNWTEVN